MGVKYETLAAEDHISLGRRLEQTLAPDYDAIVTQDGTFEREQMISLLSLSIVKNSERKSKSVPHLGCERVLRTAIGEGE